jgi:hypothetical protein
VNKSTIGPVATMTMVAMTMVGAASGTYAGSPPPPDHAAWATQCSALASADFSRIPGAPTQVMEANPVSDNKAVSARCQVRGYVTPNVGFLLQLPASNWNGKFLEIGCGGECGNFKWAFWCNLKEGYACVVTDTGHQGGGGLWAYNNLQAQVDFGYRGVHVAALSGKAIAERYYGRRPKHSYFWGCSMGGRQALAEAQRFPRDFDGIISGAPWINDTESASMFAWASRVLREKNGKPILSRTDLELVHNAVLAKCDMDDGLKDGLISNPAACNYNPDELVCKPSKQTACLTAAQAEAVKKIYAGPMKSQGDKSYVGGPAPGSEMGWVDDPDGYVRSDGTATGIEKWALKYFRYMVMPPAGPDWELADFDFDRDFQRFEGGIQESLLSAENPDLRKFKAAGGKLMIYQGWNDQEVRSMMTIDYYETATRTMGGRAAMENFARLFMVPGMLHCGGGDGPSEIDYLSYLDAWVDKAQAPDVMIGSHIDVNQMQFISAHWDSEDLVKDFEAFQNQPKVVKFSRPIYPYPVSARYKGSGDPDKADSFVTAEPPSDH